MRRTKSSRACLPILGERKKPPDEVVEFDGNIWDIDLSLYAPEGWSSSDKAMLSFDMQNTGANTRAMFRLYK